MSALNSTRPSAFVGALSMSAIPLLRGFFGSTEKYTFPVISTYPNAGMSCWLMTSTRSTSARTETATSNAARATKNVFFMGGIVDEKLATTEEREHGDRALKARNRTRPCRRRRRHRVGRRLQRSARHHIQREACTDQCAREMRGRRRLD